MLTSAPAPSGLHVAGDANLHRSDDGRLLIGGAPMRAMRLTEAGAEMVHRWLAGAAIGEAEGERRLARRLLAGGLVHPVVDAVVDLDVTVVVPVLDDEPGVRSLLAGFEGVPVVLVDDGSRQPLTISGEGITVVRNEMPLGPGAARMRGLDEVATGLVLFADADVSLDRAAIAALAGHFVDPAVVAVAPRVVSEPGVGVLASYEEDFSPLDLGPSPSPVGPGRVVSYLPSAALLARADVVRDAGGFAPELRYGEDVDLIWRLAADGRVIRYDPSVVVHHRSRPGWPAWIRQRVGYGSSAAPLAARHGEAMAPARVPTPVAVGLAGALVAPRRALPLIAAATGLEVHRRVRTAFGDHAPSAITRGALEHSTGSTVSALVRAWWPLTFVASLFSSRIRCRAAVGLAAVVVTEYARSGHRVDPVRGVAIRLADHLAYGIGVWRGVIRQRSFAAIRPVIGNGHRPASSATVGEP